MTCSGWLRGGSSNTLTKRTRLVCMQAGPAQCLQAITTPASLHWKPPNMESTLHCPSSCSVASQLHWRHTYSAGRRQRRRHRGPTCTRVSARSVSKARTRSFKSPRSSFCRHASSRHMQALDSQHKFAVPFITCLFGGANGGQAYYSTARPTEGANLWEACQAAEYAEQHMTMIQATLKGCGTDKCFCRRKPQTSPEANLT